MSAVWFLVAAAGGTAIRTILLSTNTEVPWGTLAVNLGGSFVLGLMVGADAANVVIAVGGIGVFVHMAVLTALYQALDYGFVTSQVWATLVAMTANFIIINLITYRDLQLKGIDWLKGWISFVLACSNGAVANVGVAGYLFAEDTGWFLAGFAGIVVGAVWNYPITQLYTWRTSK